MKLVLSWLLFAIIFLTVYLPFYGASRRLPHLIFGTLNFRDFLKEQRILGKVEARALKQAVSLQFDRLLNEKELTKTQMAARMKTSRAAVDRLLDASNPSVTLNTFGKAARALGRKIKIKLVST